MRVGLAGEQTSQETLDRLLPTIRNDMVFESDAIRDAQFENHSRIRETASSEENATEMAKFLGVSGEKAHEITSTDYLFAD